MAGSVVAVMFGGACYLISKADFDNRPYRNSGTDFLLRQDVKLVPFNGGEAITVGKLTGENSCAIFTCLPLGPTLPGGVNPMLKGCEDRYWKAIAKSQDPGHQAERKMQAMLKYYGVQNLLANCVDNLNAQTQYRGSQRCSSQNYDNVIQRMKNVIADQGQFRIEMKQTLDAESHRHFEKLKRDVSDVRDIAIWYLAVKLANRGVRLQEGPNFPNTCGLNVSLNQLNKGMLEQAGFGRYDISCMLAMKDVVSEMKKSIQLCREALDEHTHEQRSLGDFYNTQVRKQMCVPIQSNDPFSAPGVRQFQEFIPCFPPAPPINPFFVPFSGMMSNGYPAPAQQMNNQFFGPGMTPFLYPQQMPMGGPVHMGGFASHY